MQIFDDRMMADLSAKAKAAPRKRAHHNIHSDLNEAVQRMFIAIEPGSYVRPHRHTDPGKWEFFQVVRGTLAALVFDDSGRVSQRLELKPAGPQVGFEIPPGTWHSVVALEPGSLFLEVKQGPYQPAVPEDFAPWAPAEGEPGDQTMVAWLAEAREGDTAPGAA